MSRHISHSYLLLAVCQVVVLGGAGPISAATGVLLFDETTDTISVAGETPIGSAVTYEARIRFTDTYAGQGSLYNEWKFLDEDKQFNVGPAMLAGFNFRINWPNVQRVDYAFAMDQWHHIAFTYDGSAERLYIDGQLQAQRAASGTVASVASIAHVGAIYRDNQIRPSFLGFLDTFRISNVARYTGASFVPPTGDLSSDANTLILYNFDESPGATTIVDHSGNGHTGTLGAGFGAATMPTFISSGDLDYDGDVDVDDIDILRNNMGNLAYDLDGDGDTDADDLGHLVEDLVEWHRPGTGASGVGTEMGDFNLDGVIDTTDLAILAANFGTVLGGWSIGHANTDSVIDTTDLAILATNFGFVASGEVPEPATLSLLAVGGLALLRRRKRDT